MKGTPERNCESFQNAPSNKPQHAGNENGRKLRAQLARAIVWIVRVYARQPLIRRGRTWIATLLAKNLWRIGDPGASPVVYQTGAYKARLSLSPASVVGAYIHILGSYEAGEVRRCIEELRCAQSTPILLDVGANVGLYSVLVASHVPGCRVYAFEPMEENCERMEEALSLNEESIADMGSNVQVIRAALAESRGVRRFVASGDSGWGSLIEPAGRRERVVDVETISGDEFLAEHDISYVDYCKIDVEGAELIVLAGFEESLRKGAIGTLQVEVWRNPIEGQVTFREVVAFLKSFGYKIARLQEQFLESEGWQMTDIIASRSTSE